MSAAPDNKETAAEDFENIEIIVDEKLSGAAEQVVEGEVEVEQAAEKPGSDRLEREQRAPEDDEDDDEVIDDGDVSKAAQRARQRRINRKRRLEAQRAMEAQILQQGQILHQVLQRLDQQSAQSVESQYRSAMDHVSRAEQLMKDAVERGDGDAHVKAMRYRDEAVATARRLAPAVEQQRRGGPQQPSQPMQPDPELLRRVEAFQKKHQWYSPNGADADSALVRQLDDEVARLGYDPRTSDYWDELTDRLREKLPHRFKVGERKAPAIGDRGQPVTPGGKVTYRISPEMRAHMEEAGIWDDPKRRAKVLADHFRILKQNSR